MSTAAKLWIGFSILGIVALGIAYWVSAPTQSGTPKAGLQGETESQPQRPGPVIAGCEKLTLTQCVENKCGADALPADTMTRVLQPCDKMRSLVGLGPTPLMGWVQDHQEKFVLDPGAVHAVAMTPNKWGDVHYAIEATEPVNVGWGKYQGKQFTQDPQPEDVNALEKLGDHHVSPGNIPIFLLTDVRNFQNDALPAAVGVMVGSKSEAKSLMAQNRVTVSFFRWDCVKNCQGK